MIRFGYNWRYYARHPLRLISEVYWDSRQGVASIWDWLPILWYDRDWDWCYLMEMMERKFLRMAKVMDRGYHVGADLSARELRMAAQLCKRIRNTHYYWVWDDPIRNKDWAPPLGPWHHRYDNHMFDKKYHKCYDDYMIEQDTDLLFKLMRRKLRTWWD